MSRLCGGWRPWRGGLAPPKRVRVWAAATVVPVSRLMGGDRVGGRWGGAAKMRAYVTSGNAPKSDTIKRSSTPRRVDSHAARVAWLACWWQEFNMPVAAGSAGLYTRGARRNLRMCFRLIQAVSTRRATQSCIDPAFWAEPFWRPGARHTRSKTKGAPTRSSLACFAHPAPGWLLGSHTVMLVDLLEIYNDTPPRLFQKIYINICVPPCLRKMLKS